MLPDAAATSATPLLDLTPNAASKVVCTTARGGMVVEGELGPWCACDSLRDPILIDVLFTLVCHHLKGAIACAKLQEHDEEFTFAWT